MATSMRSVWTAAFLGGVLSGCAASPGPSVAPDDAGASDVTPHGLGSIVHAASASSRGSSSHGETRVGTAAAEPSATTTAAARAASTSGVATVSATGTTDGGVAAATTTSAGPACPTAGVDLSQMTIYANPPDLASWPVTTILTEVDFTDEGVAPQFSKIDGADRWPDVTPPGWTGPLEYTIGMAECIDGAWYASAVIEVWYGLAAAGGNVADADQVAKNWFYDAGRWGLLAGRQPATGETIGIFVAAGNLRDVTADDPAQSPVMERSNVVFVPMPDVSGATHPF